MATLFLARTILKSKENGKIVKENEMKIVHIVLLILGVKVV